MRFRFGGKKKIKRAAAKKKLQIIFFKEINEIIDKI